MRAGQCEGLEEYAGLLHDNGQGVPKYLKTDQYTTDTMLREDDS